MIQKDIVILLVFLGIMLVLYLVIRWLIKETEKRCAYLKERIAEMNALQDELWPADAVYLDADVTPYEAATMILATLGPVYTNQLIDECIDALKLKPSKE